MTIVVMVVPNAEPDNWKGLIMLRRVSLTIAALVIVIVAGCGDQQSDVTGLVVSPAAIAEKALCDDFAITPELLASLEWDELSGTLIPGFGGVLHGQLASWPSGSDFSILVPSSALHSDGGAVDFTLRVPTRQSYEDNPCLRTIIMDLKPSGYLFRDQITIACTYMPWIPVGASEYENFDFWSIDPEAPGGVPEAFQAGRLVRFRFDVDHFSLWGLGDDDDDGLITD